MANIIYAMRLIKTIGNEINISLDYRNVLPLFFCTITDCMLMTTMSVRSFIQTLHRSIRSSNPS